jgi:hypothetical protein
VLIVTSTDSQSDSGTRDLIAIDALGPTGEYRTRSREVISDTAGAPVAVLSIALRLYVTRTIAAQRRLCPLPPAARESALAKTSEIFAKFGDRRRGLRPVR